MPPAGVLEDRTGALRALILPWPARGQNRGSFRGLAEIEIEPAAADVPRAPRIRLGDKGAEEPKKAGAAQRLEREFVARALDAERDPERKAQRPGAELGAEHGPAAEIVERQAAVRAETQLAPAMQFGKGKGADESGRGHPPQ